MSHVNFWERFAVASALAVSWFLLGPGVQGEELKTLAVGCLLFIFGSYFTSGSLHTVAVFLVTTSLLEVICNGWWQQLQGWRFGIFAIVLLSGAGMGREGAGYRPATAVAAAAFFDFPAPVGDVSILACGSFSIMKVVLLFELWAVLIFVRPLRGFVGWLRVWVILEPSIVLLVMWILTSWAFEDDLAWPWMSVHIFPNIAVPASVGAFICLLRHLFSVVAPKLPFFGPDG